MFEDRWYQREAVQSLFSYFEAGNTGNPLIAMPTGTGKSVVIARFVQEVFKRYAGQRIMMLTHVMELIEQNAKKLQQLWPQAPLGIYSSGLNERDTVLPITFGGIASVVNVVHLFGRIDLLIVDEAHLISNKADSMYNTVINALKLVNPYMKTIGLTATDYRMGSGRLTDEGGLFTDLIYDLTNVEAFNRLIAEGFLAPLIPKRTTLELDISGVGIQNGDFAAGALERAVDKDEITRAALAEACAAGIDRRSWLCFSSGNKHAEHCAEVLNEYGISATFVHSGIKKKERKQRIADYKAGKYRCLVGNNIFTTGFDHPELDMIIDLQPTLSVVKHVQKYGRGTRPSPMTHKANCLVLDFARNTKRLGPINDPIKPRKKGSKPGEAPIRICDSCGVYNHASARFCCNCGAEFTFAVKIFEGAGTEELLRTTIPVVEYYDVNKVIYSQHRKGEKYMLKASYYCGMFKFDEYINFEGEKFALKKARDWWRQRHMNEPPNNVTEALLHISGLRMPKRIKVWVNKQYPEILSYEW